MATNNEYLECVICNEILVDPRALPCGHSYCGPPRLCLSSMKIADGGLCCAVCRAVHNLEADDIKPLYGIRDFLQAGTSKSKPAKSLRLSCSSHENKDCTFWCTKCAGMFCNFCFDEHDGHLVRSLKKYLVEKIESKLGKPLYEGIIEYQNYLERTIDSKRLVLEESKSRASSIEFELDNTIQQKTMFDQLLEFQNGKNLGSVDFGVETVLLNSLDNKISKLSLEKIRQEYENIVADVKSSNSTQTDYLSVSSSTQTDSFSRLNAKSSASPILKSAEKISPCDCGYEHRVNMPMSFPITLLANLQISSRKPLTIEKSDEVVICPFQFWITANSKDCSRNRMDKTLQIILNCCHTYKKTLPEFSFGYKFWMRNFGCRSKDRRNEGTWKYPTCDKLVWDAILYSDLANPQSNWIDCKDQIEIILQLKS